jgi:hypothetical protein
VRTFEASSAKVVSQAKWSWFSMVHCERTIIVRRSGGCLAAGEVGQHVDRLACELAGLHADPVADDLRDLRDLRGVREADAEGDDGQDLHHPGLQPPVAMGAVVELRRAWRGA